MKPSPHRGSAGPRAGSGQAKPEVQLSNVFAWLSQCRAEVLKEHGLQLEDFLIMDTVASARATNVGGVGEQCGCADATCTRWVERVVGLRFLRKSRSATGDKRHVHLALTAQGLRKYEQVRNGIAQCVDNQFSNWSTGTRVAGWRAVALLSKIATGLPTSGTNCETASLSLFLEELSSEESTSTHESPNDNRGGSEKRPLPIRGDPLTAASADSSQERNLLTTLQDPRGPERQDDPAPVGHGQDVRSV